jgi:branched-chain amino acid transport system ATP-binding protein
MLSIENVDVFYGKAQALHHVTVMVDQDEIVSLIGRNGAGKSTTVKAMMGLLPCAKGRRYLDGEDVTSKKAHLLSRLGVAYVPETRDIFSDLTVMGNLRSALVVHKLGHWTFDRIFELFPALKDRAKSKGDTLSGGEQKMLAIGRGLMTSPRVLLLDEPTEGLAPILVNAFKEAIETINREHVSVFLVEQNLKIPLSLAHRQYIIENGVIVWKGSTSELIDDKQNVEKYICL